MVSFDRLKEILGEKYVSAYFRNGKLKAIEVSEKLTADEIDAIERKFEVVLDLPEVPAGVIQNVILYIATSRDEKKFSVS